MLKAIVDDSFTPGYEQAVLLCKTLMYSLGYIGYISLYPTDALCT